MPGILYRMQQTAVRNNILCGKVKPRTGSPQKPGKPLNSIAQPTIPSPTRNGASQMPSLDAVQACRRSQRMPPARAASTRSCWQTLPERLGKRFGNGTGRTPLGRTPTLSMEQTPIFPIAKFKLSTVANFRKLQRNFAEQMSRPTPVGEPSCQQTLPTLLANRITPLLTAAFGTLSQIHCWSSSSIGEAFLERGVGRLVLSQ